MKTLCLQLTRLGDILYSLPALAAYHKAHPEAELHLLVRKKWAGVAHGLSFIHKVWEWDSEAILGGVVATEDFRAALPPLKDILGQLAAEDFSHIINLSFSPSSSWLTRVLEKPGIKISGYTRTADGFLHIPDEASLYFRAQVGFEKFNRIHVTNLFNWVVNEQLHFDEPAHVELAQKQPDGWVLSETDYVVIHPGASTAKKTWPLPYWQRALNQWLRKTKLNFVIVGAANERKWGDQLSLLEPGRVHNWVGKTSFAELAFIIKRARLFVGTDSGPLQFANLIETPLLNLSVGPVNHWETGPKNLNGFVVRADDPWQLTTDSVIDAVLNLTGYLPGPKPSLEPATEMGWELVQFLYFGSEPPKLGSLERVHLKETLELSEVALQQLDYLKKNPGSSLQIEILDRVDEIFKLYERHLPDLKPLYWNFYAWKENIGPGSYETIVDETRKIYLKTHTICRNLENAQIQEERGKAL